MTGHRSIIRITGPVQALPVRGTFSTSPVGSSCDGLSADPDKLWSISDDAKNNRSGVLTSLDVKTLLASVEAAPPIDAAEVVAASLTDALGARDVSFLIADYSGQALVRLSHVHRASPDDEDVNRERGQSVALEGTPHGRALTQQEIQIVPDFDGYRVFAPVTEPRRGSRGVGAGTR